MNETDGKEKAPFRGSAWLDQTIREEFMPQWKERFEQMVLKLYPEMNDPEHAGIRRGFWDAYKNGALGGTLTTIKYIRERYDFVEKKKNEPAPLMTTTKAN